MIRHYCHQTPTPFIHLVTYIRQYDKQNELASAVIKGS